MVGVIASGLALAWLVAVHARYQLTPVGGGYPVVYRLDRWTGEAVLVTGRSPGAAAVARR